MISNPKFKHLFPVIFWMLFIFWMSTGTFSAQNTSRIIEPVLHFLMPGLMHQQIAVIHGLIRKCGHITEYFVLGLLLFRYLRWSFTDPRVWRHAIFAAIIVLLYAIGDEFHQSFVSTRTASAVDVGIDAISGILAQAVSVIWHYHG
jgi:VanZ family protein